MTVTTPLSVTGEAVVTGGVLSRFTAGLDVATALPLPARSVTDFVTVRPVPSPEITEFAHAPTAKPDPPVSLHAQATDTFVLYQPAPLGLPTGARDCRAGFFETQEKIMRDERIVWGCLRA